MSVRREGGVIARSSFCRRPLDCAPAMSRGCAWSISTSRPARCGHPARDAIKFGYRCRGESRLQPSPISGVALLPRELTTCSSATSQPSDRSSAGTQSPLIGLIEMTPRVLVERVSEETVRDWMLPEAEIRGVRGQFEPRGYPFGDFSQIDLLLGSAAPKSHARAWTARPQHGDMDARDETEAGSGRVAPLSDLGVPILTMVPQKSPAQKNGATVGSPWVFMINASCRQCCGSGGVLLARRLRRRRSDGDHDQAVEGWSPAHQI